MDEKRETSLPLPKLANDPAFVGSSPSNDGYVTVLTPDNKALAPGMDGPDFDPSGLRMNVWTVDLFDGDLRTAYYWWVCCCPCVPLAQLETRLGLNSFIVGLLIDLIAFTGRFALIITAVITICYGYVVISVVCLGLWALSLNWVGHRVARVRVQTRERLDIAGTFQQDFTTGRIFSASAIRQMAVQLKCDQLHLGAPATLQAYQV
ncbi:Uncharacterised protein family Cys-rich [Plasmopara halstedii]|uniref:Uncharacterized protein family Cys-rich n=1 Tax=Plasmopara halstedii TaxID=4781 RepID=A0A0P1ASX6_PLAHL|nr:Uncharacterised protein family Cys-rich [Plasmopara halstedii]CEG45272.1 Uncharacterised protein family Cys-rich [Plasmopara halstedii]|eukprot:XP_024581641.1 Uncharacterised protein family Cys-rich [Plasmopara halstedii]